MNSKPTALVIGAGPAGLSATLELTDGQIPVTVLEASGIVGGIAQTANYKGFLFDIGGHRFFTKVKLIDDMWRRILPDEFIRRPRLSRIFYRKVFFDYPLKPLNVVKNLGLFESARCVLSYLKARVFPKSPEPDFETWVSNRFGTRLFQIFFKSYTEKVWGIPCTSIRAEWAAQRIQGLSLVSLIKNALGFTRKGSIKTLIDQFDYPRRGPGQLWQKAAEMVEGAGASVIFHSPVTAVRWSASGVDAVVADGRDHSASHYLSSMPIRDLIHCLSPAPPAEVLAAADGLKYRDFITVALVVKQPELFPDNWIYVHEPGVKLGRVQNFKNWSPEMVPDPAFTCLGLEYFCFEGDGLWNMSDTDLAALGRKEISELGLVNFDDVVDSAIVRMPKAYPVYDENYQESLRVIREFLLRLPNLQLIGRNGMHHYNNQDHSMLTGILAARNIMGANYNLWAVNVDGEYHEEGSEIREEELAALRGSQPMVPKRLST